MSEIAPLGEWTPEGGFDVSYNGDVQDAAALTGVSLGVERTDLGNARLFASLHGQRFRFACERSRWYEWAGNRWRLDTTGAAMRAAKKTVLERLRNAAALDGDDERKAEAGWALKSQAEARLRALLILASTESEFATEVDAFDADPYLLACPNGTLDLRTGALRPHDPGDLLSLGTEVPYNAGASCPRWEHFLLEVFAGDETLVRFVKRAAGYSLTGDTSEHKLFLCHGGGCNGKTTLLETIKRIAGDHAVTTPVETLMRARGDRGPRNDLARLHRARLVAAAESGSGRRLDEAIVKTLTGGDTVTARFLYGEHFEFMPRFKLWLTTNYRPGVDGDDEAIWRRIDLIPFTVSFRGREDKALTATLAGELPGILSWAVEGCLEWQREGLGEARAVELATSEYREAEDTLGAFLAERCALEQDARTATSELRKAYEAYCDETGERAKSATALGMALSRRGIETDRAAKPRCYVGVRLPA